MSKQGILALRRHLPEEGMLFVDVTLSEHLAAEAYTVCRPRTYFNPTDNQAMGWSVPAALGAQKVHPKRQVVTVTGDGCLMMSAMELSTAARACAAGGSSGRTRRCVASSSWCRRPQRSSRVWRSRLAIRRQRDSGR